MTDVIPHHDEVNAARTGIYMQLKETTKLVEIYGSLTQAIETLGLGDFIENQVQVNASSRAWVREMENRLRNSNIDDRSHFSKRAKWWLVMFGVMLYVLYIAILIFISYSGGADLSNGNYISAFIKGLTCIALIIIVANFIRRR